MKPNLNVRFVAYQCLKIRAFVRTRVSKPTNYNIMKKNIKFFLTIAFWGFSIRQIMLFNDMPTALFLFILGVCVALANDT